MSEAQFTHCTRVRVKLLGTVVKELTGRKAQEYVERICSREGHAWGEIYKDTCQRCGAVRRDA